MSAAKAKAQNIIDENKVGRFNFSVLVYIIPRGGFTADMREKLCESCILEILLPVLQVYQVTTNRPRCPLLRS
jgi:hypothetical protein